ncbi:UNVERIFIED_CONTAM: CTD small phosphatase-like protein 2-B [Sesamum calycinum]|uniref:CTD small phosphatase-like protein 2-B n=1 Tax=Sesamum calycinum TaxID=2727403 RepID=A0AAW2PS22_9LAMI
MQTKKKSTGRSSRELASPRISRQQKKLVENVQVQGKKVTELITSSARKKKVASQYPKALTFSDDSFGAFIVTIMTMGLLIVCRIPYFLHPFTLQEVLEGKFQPKTSVNSFSMTKQIQDCGKENIQIDCPGGHVLSPEVSAIYLSMKNSNLECIDENNQDHMSVDVCQEDEDAEEYDDFDPYYFIKNLPELSSVVPAFRPVLLPKQTRSCPSTTLVLDLDETLVHSTLEPCDDADFTFSVNFNLKDHTVYVRCRPHLTDFLERVSRLFEIIIFTASQSIYAEQLLNVLDPRRKIFRHRVYRDSCVFVDGNYLKDLSVLGRDLAHVIIIDNSPQAFGFQVDNGIPIESWFEDRSDTELLLLLPFLESLVGVQDEGFLPVKYLGVPLISSRLTMADCKPLIDKLDSRIAGWNHLNLTYAGRAQLMKINGARICESSIEQVCRPKEEGGLGFCNILVMNQALMLKHLWKLIQNDRNSIWADWIIKHRLHKKTLWTFHGSTGSWGWKKMIKLRPFFQRGLQYKVGDGLYFQLWQDIWHERGPLCVSYPQGPNVTGLPIDSLLSSNATWSMELADIN